MFPKCATNVHLPENQACYSGNEMHPPKSTFSRGLDLQHMGLWDVLDHEGQHLIYG